eukprot:1441926-Amphidinium_carterae.1
MIGSTTLTKLNLGDVYHDFNHIIFLFPHHAPPNTLQHHSTGAHNDVHLKGGVQHRTQCTSLPRGSSRKRGTTRDTTTPSRRTKYDFGTTTSLISRV